MSDAQVTLMIVFLDALCHEFNGSDTSMIEVEPIAAE